MLTTEVMVTKIDEDDKKSRVTGVDRLAERVPEFRSQQVEAFLAYEVQYS